MLYLKKKKNISLLFFPRTIGGQEASVLSSHRLSCFFPGCTLFFYETDGRSGIDNNSIPKHAIWVENSIVQAVPEHPKKDFVFCLSNSLGDAFLFQVRECLRAI